MKMRESVYRKFLGFIDNSPFVESLVEVFVIVLFTIGPLYASALTEIANSNSELTFSKINFNVRNYLSHGELCFLILSFCGAIFWISILKAQQIYWIIRVILGIYLISFVYLSASFITRDPGFSSDQAPNWLFSLTLSMYIATIIVFFLVSFFTKEARADYSSESRAKQIVAESKKL